MKLWIFSTFFLILCLLTGCKQSECLIAEMQVPNVPILALKPSNSVAQISLINREKEVRNVKEIVVCLQSSEGLCDFRRIELRNGDDVLSSHRLHLTGKRAQIECPVSVIAADMLVAWRAKRTLVTYILKLT